MGDRVVVNDVADGVVTRKVPGGNGWWKVRLHGRHAREDRSYRRTQITKLHVPPAAPAPAPAPPPAAVGADVEATPPAQLRVDTTPAGRAPALKVCAVQLRATPGDVEGNLRRAEQLIRANPGHHLYVLPELSSCGYSDEVLADCAAFAHGSFDGVFKFFIDLAREVDAHICFDFLCRTSRPLSAVPAVGSRVLAASHPGHVTRVNAVAAAADVLFDSGTERTYLLAELRTPVFTIAQAVVGPTGIELVYDKMHLCDMGACSEVAHGLTRGERPGVFTCRGWRVGVCICYDLRFPELWRRLAWEEDCDLIVHPSAFVPAHANCHVSTHSLIDLQVRTRRDVSHVSHLRDDAGRGERYLRVIGELRGRGLRRVDSRAAVGRARAGPRRPARARPRLRRGRPGAQLRNGRARRRARGVSLPAQRAPVPARVAAGRRDAGRCLAARGAGDAVRAGGTGAREPPPALDGL